MAVSGKINFSCYSSIHQRLQFYFFILYFIYLFFMERVFISPAINPLILQSNTHVIDCSCSLCHSLWQTCNGSSETQCITGWPGQHALSGTCSSVCPDGYYAVKKQSVHSALLCKKHTTFIKLEICNAPMMMWCFMHKLVKRGRI
jgi:hypothetical protein